MSVYRSSDPEQYNTFIEVHFGSRLPVHLDQLPAGKHRFIYFSSGGSYVIVTIDADDQESDGTDLPSWGVVVETSEAGSDEAGLEGRLLGTAVGDGEGVIPRIPDSGSDIERLLIEIQGDEGAEHLLLKY